MTKQKFLDYDGLKTLAQNIDSTINTKLSSVYKYKGTVATLADLPANPEVGDVYNIETGNKVVIDVRKFDIVRADSYNEALQSTKLYFSNDISDIQVDVGSTGIAYDKTLNELGHVYGVSRNNKWIEIDGDHSVSGLTECYVVFDNNDFNTDRITFGDVDSGDNLAWTGEYWDELAGTIDVSQFAVRADTLKGYGIKDAYTKAESDMHLINLELEMNAKLSSVYKYKGSVNSFEDLPEVAEIGDVWNVATAYQKSVKVRPMTVENVSGMEGMGCTDFTIAEDDANVVAGAGAANIYDPEMNFLGRVSGVGRWTTLMVYHANLQPGEYYFEFDNAEYNTLEFVSVSINAGDNVAWTGSYWDVLSGAVDLSDYATKDDVNTKLSSVYKYKGTVANYTDLPSNAEIGDVYNIETTYKVSIKAYPVVVTEIDTGAPSWIDLITEPNAFSSNMANLSVKVYNSNGVAVGNGYIGHGANIIQLYADGDVNPGTYYVEFDDASFNTTDVIVSKINAGDNVAWTGSEWDKLAGTIDLSNYATKEEVSGLVSIREATFEEIDAALDSMTASYTEMKTLTEEIIAEQNALM